MNEFKMGMQAKTMYSGDQKIKKILETLGANQCIANNPRVIEAVSIILEEISEIKDIEEAIQGDDNEKVSYAKELRTQKIEAQLEGMFPEYAFYQKGIPDEEKKRILQFLEYLIPGKQCSDEELGHIVEFLKKCIPLSNEDLKKWIELKEAPKGSRLHKYGVYYGIKVNKDGSVGIQEVTAFKSGAYTEKRTRFGISKSGEIVESSIQQKIGSDSLEEKSQTSVIEATGVVKERKARRKLTSSSKDKAEEVKIIRSNDNPAIAIVQKGGKTYFSPIDLDTLYDLPDVIHDQSVKLYKTHKDAMANIQTYGMRCQPRYREVVDTMLEEAGILMAR